MATTSIRAGLVLKRGVIRAIDREGRTRESGIDRDFTTGENARVGWWVAAIAEKMKRR
ncbi:hypothetical protein V0288_15995 [Pannus brasiliensis CCIBt3594]|uniref:Uncharacterized protein n=1 Tax=Pannus brasiliensis CCIBt3594 TaxID=1427578 RepID=A0AAW9QP30_9CHRO